MKTHTTFNVETKPLGVDGFLVYRCTQEINTKGRKPKTATWEGVCKERDKPSPGNTKAFPSLPRDAMWCLVQESAIADAARYGWVRRVGSVDEFTISDRLSKTPFTDLGTKGWVIVRAFHDGHMLFDRKNKALPVARHCDYIEWRMDNGHYDLDKAFKILEVREDIHNLQRAPIPYYNADGGRTETLIFTWTPSVRTYRRAWKWCLENHPRFPSTAFAYAAEALNLFGLKKVRK
jgi:hypothetical protein